ncbi:hypothetical protein NX059_003287 [Plenodomus lindquistii]|nr:hypothetical protein NX059_003287 [Plenodomus lindquistii]
MGDFCYGISFMKRQNNTCAAVAKDCVYATCRDQGGDHCYAVQGAAVDRPYNLTSSAYTCDNYCPAAYASYVPMKPSECCTAPDQIYSCGVPDGPETCQCYDFWRFKIASLTSLTLALSSPSVASNSSSSAETFATSTATARSTSTSTGSLLVQTSPHLSTAANAGIAVGSIFGGLALFGLAGWLAWRLVRGGRRRQRQSITELPAVFAPLPLPPPPSPPPPPPQPSHTKFEPIEEKSETRYEVDADQTHRGYAELASPNVGSNKLGDNKF